MNDENRTKQQLIAELAELRRRVAELEGGSGGGDLHERRELGDASCQADNGIFEQDQDRLRTILSAAGECLPFSFWVLGSDGRYVLANAASRALWGDIVAQRPSEVAGDEKRLAAWSENHRRAWPGERVENDAEFTVRGETRSFHNVLAPIRMGEHIIGILGYNMDITDRKRTETALRESEQRFHAFMDNAPYVAWMNDEQCRYVYVSKSFEKRFAMRYKDWRGTTDFEHWPAEMAERFRKNDVSVLASGRVLEVIEETINSDGGVSQWWVFTFPFREAHGYDGVLNGQPPWGN